MSVSVRIADVGKTFERAGRARSDVALYDVSLAIAPGELIALVGPSGSGKTTLLNIVAGLVRPDRGTVAVTRSDGRQPRMSMVFQQPRLLEWQTVGTNVRLAADAAGVSRERIADALRAVELDGYADAYPLTLSGGQRQRVALARALVIEPDIVLFDEPFSALDEFTARKLRRVVQDLRERHSFTGILVTHNTLEAAFLADRIVTLEAHPGRVIGDERVDVPRPRDPDDERLFHVQRGVLRLLGA
jgi:NitT/TauT family transport system ATP-binding protein